MITYILKKTRIRGFALVVTLSLMVLLTIIAVGLLSLSAISLRTGSRAAANAEARSNARLALMLAVGELQLELGPDRRINCQAGIDNQALPNHRNWLAVYNAWNASERDRPDTNGSFRTYLVSGDRTALKNRNAARTALPGKNVEIVGNDKVGPEGKVNVGLVPVANASGNYGWWISDENSKAKINAGLDIPTSVSPELLAIETAQSAPGVGFRMVGALGNTNTTGRASWEMGNTLRTKNLSMASAELLPGVSGSLYSHFHDLTTASYGLLSDVRNGSLKRDLSLYLEQPHSSRLRQPLYTVNGSANVSFSPDGASATTLDQFSGITMEELWIYYNLYKEVLHNRPAVSNDTVGRRPAGFPTLLSGNSRDAVMADRFYPYKRRVYAQVKYMLSLAATPSAAQAGKFDLQLAVDPVVILWNPYNVALEYQTGGFTTVGFSGLPYIAEFQTPTGTVTVPFTSFFPHGNVNLIPAVIGRNQPIILQPGETRVFSRVQGQGDALEAGWRYTEGTLLNNANFPKNLDRNANVRLTLRPNTTAFVNYLTFWFGLRSQSPALQSGTYILRGDRPASTLPTVTTPQTLTVGNVVDDKKIPHMLISQNMRPENDATTISKSWLWSNPSVSYRRAADSTLESRLSHQMEIFVTQVSTWENPYVQITPGNQAYWGGGTRADFGVPFFTLRGVPLTPLKSIGSFQHSCANGMRRYWKDSTVFTPRPGIGFPGDAEGLDGHRYLAPMGSKLIGNSFAHPLIPAGQTRHQVTVADDQDAAGTSSVTIADHAYLANAALWDSWYFSSLAPQTVHPYRANPRTLQQIFDEFYPAAANVEPIPLPSARMTPYRHSNETALRALVQSDTPNPEAYRKLAAHLMVDGAFNVNSTSVTAWKVILASLRGHTTGRMDNASGGFKIESAASDSTPVNALGIANGASATPSANTSEALQWSGFRKLSDSEIENLATELVKEIRLRGPFLCLSDFVNRRPGGDTDLARHGALQAAIETSGINGALDKGSRALGSITGAPFPDAGKGSRAAGIPGHISQADLLTPLGPILQARSDTFTIRAYGNAQDPSGNLLAEAWCEATVQRTPEYLNPVDAPEIQEANLTQPVNRTFGRKLRIIGFRWLSSTVV